MTRKPRNQIDIDKLPRAKSDESWTTAEAERECARRQWELGICSWKVRVPPRREGAPWTTWSKDFLGCLDGIAFGRPDGDTAPPYFLQWTSRQNVAARVRKIREARFGEYLPRVLPYLLATGGRVLVWGFSQDGRLREVEVT